MAGKSFISNPTAQAATSSSLLPSSKLASFQNQQLGSLMGPTAAPALTGGGGIQTPTAAPTGVRAARAQSPAMSRVAVQSGDTTKKVAEGNVRLAALQRAAAPKVKPQGLEGQYTGGVKSGRNSAPGGNISVKDTVRIGNAYLRKDAGNAFIQMNNAFKQATGRSLGITEGWRSYDEQVRLYNLYRAGKGNLAAKPGTSTHGKGTAVDMNGYGDPNGPAFKWLQQNAGRFGYKWTGGTFSQIEPWHWDYVG